MAKTRTTYFVTITSRSKNDFLLKMIFKKFDRSIRRIRTFSTQKTFCRIHGQESIKYLHNFVVTTKPRADFPKVWYGLINNPKKILNLEIKLLNSDDHI